MLAGAVAQDFLVLLHFAYPILLVAVFLAAFTVHSIATASEDATSVPTQLTGPGGKPLPRTRNQKAKEKAQQEQRDYDFSPARKLFFHLGSAGVVLTFALNAAIVILHAVWDRTETWWCGQHVVVSSPWLGSLWSRRLTLWARSTSWRPSSSIRSSSFPLSIRGPPPPWRIA
jgi:hypothetical protein